MTDTTDLTTRLLAAVVATGKSITTPREAVALLVDAYLATLGFRAGDRDDGDAFSRTYKTTTSTLHIEISAPYQRINYCTSKEETAICITGRSGSAASKENDNTNTYATVPLQDFINSSALPWSPRADDATVDNTQHLAQQLFASPAAVATLTHKIQAHILQPLVPDLAAPGYVRMSDYGAPWPSYRSTAADNDSGVVTENENTLHGPFLTGRNYDDVVKSAPSRGEAMPDETTTKEFLRDAGEGPSLAQARLQQDVSAPPPPPQQLQESVPSPPTADFAPPRFDDELQMAQRGGVGSVSSGGGLGSGMGSDLHQPNLGPNDPLQRFLPGTGAGGGLGVGPGGFSGMHPTFDDPVFRNNRPHLGIGGPGLGQGYPYGPPPGARYDDPMGDVNDELAGPGGPGGMGMGGLGGLGGLGGPGFRGHGGPGAPRGPRGGFGGLGRGGAGLGGGFGDNFGGFGGGFGGGII